MTKFHEELVIKFPSKVSHFKHQTFKKHFFYTKFFWIQIWQKKNALVTTNLKSRQNSINQIFNQCALFFILLTCVTWYYHTIYLVFLYFAAFTYYEDDIFDAISNWHVQGSKLGGKMDKFGEKSFKKLNVTEFIEFVFSRSGKRTLHR